MTGYRLSPAARADLGQIWEYSALDWGMQLADRYVLAIRDACAALEDGSRHSRVVENIRSGYRQLNVQSHFLLYRLGTPG